MKFGNSGTELSAIIGAEKIIIANKPRIASVLSNFENYDTYESVVEIAKYLWSLNPNYNIYLRHYTNYASVTVIYALP